MSDEKEGRPEQLTEAHMTEFEALLSKYVLIFPPEKGYFAILPKDIVEHIFRFVEDDLAYSRIYRVCREWKRVVEVIWKEHCRKRGYLEDESFWNTKGRDWKWILQCKEHTFKAEDTNKHGIGWFETVETNGNVGPRPWRYEGEWMDNNMNGLGFKKDFKTGGQYKGNWVNGKLEGQGIFIDKCGDRYDGNWVNGTKDGYGTYYWGEGRWKGHKYIGGWKAGKMHGTGKYSYPSGTFYQGEWYEDMMHGKGIYSFANGDLYDGEWADDKRFGYGVFTFDKHGCRYQGEFKGVREGKGALIWKNGDRFDGEWKMNSRIGSGILRCVDGTIYKQEWNETPGALYYNVEPARFPDPERNQGFSYLVTEDEELRALSKQVFVK